MKSDVNCGTCSDSITMQMLETSTYEMPNDPKHDDDVIHDDAITIHYNQFLLSLSSVGILKYLDVVSG